MHTKLYEVTHIVLSKQLPSWDKERIERERERRDAAGVVHYLRGPSGYSHGDDDVHLPPNERNGTIAYRPAPCCLPKGNANWQYQLSLFDRAVTKSTSIIPAMPRAVVTCMYVFCKHCPEDVISVTCCRRGLISTAMIRMGLDQSRPVWLHSMPGATGRGGSGGGDIC